VNKITFKKYKNILDDYSYKSGISVSYKNLEKSGGDAQWSPSHKEILLNSTIEDFGEELSNYLHELGHMRDDYMPKNKKEEKLINIAYDRFNQYLINSHSNKSNKRITITNNQKKIIIETEYRAWINGKAVANQLGIKLGNWYQSQMDLAISHIYQNLFRFYKYELEKDYINGILNLQE
jgi:hypothetical protein